MAYKTTKRQRDMMKKYYRENKEKIMLVKKKYSKNHKNSHYKSMKKWRKGNELEKYNDKIRHRTIKKHGRLKKGFEYHHITKPLQEDEFIILEGNFHKYYHNNLNKFNLKKLR